MKTSIKTIPLLATLAVGWASPLFSQVPDLTKDSQSVDRKLTYNLGATGMRGWIHTKPETKADAEYGRTTGASRQILVTHVGANSPADGVMQVDDVILGIDDQPFTDDARKSIARAIQEAEKSPVAGAEGNPKKTSSGSLVLLRWRAGKTESVALKMRVLGTYSETAPYNCPKSAKILEEALPALQKETGMWKEISGLAMLATGDPRYMPQIKAIAQDVGSPTLKYDMAKMHEVSVWHMGYQGIFLCEYFLLTGDKSVEHALKETSVTLAKGQSMYGTLGHGISDLTKDGKLHGSIGKETKVPAWLTKQEVADAIAAGRFDLERMKMSAQELTTALGNWSPIVRLWAAEELAKRQEAQAMVPQWITAAEGTNARLRLGACEALHQLKTQQALTVFVRLLYHEDRGLRFLAARAIRDLGVAAQPALNDILKAFVDTAEPLVPVNFADPIQLAHGQLIPALFSGGLTDALKQADPKLVLEAVRVGSKNADNMARSNLEGFINRLTVDEVKTLLPDIVELAVSHGPADTMFSREIRVSAFKVLVKYHFQEGIKAAPLVARGKYGSHNTAEVMALLETYGSAAKVVIPDLKNLLVHYKELNKIWAFPKETYTSIEHAIKVIEAAKDHPELLSAGPMPTPAKEPKK